MTTEPRDRRALAAVLERGLRERADPERREFTKGYFPTRMEILGVSAADMRGVLREHRERWRALSPPDVVDLARALAGSGVHEVRQVAYLLLEQRKDARAELDRPLLEALGRGNDNWASVDTFATLVAGPAWRDGRIDDDVVREWASSDDVWWRRTAVVCTVALNTRSRGGTGDPRRTLDICERVAGDRHAMVAKGLSWALRSLVGHDRAGVQAFLDRHGDGLAARVRREVRSKLATGRKSG